MADDDMAEAREELDAAVRVYASRSGDGFIVSGWVLAASAFSPNDEPGFHNYLLVKNTDQPFHVTLGLLENARADLLDGVQRRRTNDDD